MSSLRVSAYTVWSALRSMWAYPLRSTLTALGVMMGVATVIGIFSIIEGLGASFQDRISAMGTGTLYVSRRPWIVLGDWWRYRGRPSITSKDAKFLAERLTLATDIVPFAFHRVTIEAGRASLDQVRVIGTTSGWARMSGFEPSEGRFLTDGDAASARHVVVLGADVAEALEREGIDILDHLRVAGRPMRLIGVMPERGRIFGRSQDDFVVIPLSLFERMFGARRSMSVGVVVDPTDLDRGTDEIIGAMRVRHGLAPADPNDFSINQQQMFVELYKKLTKSLFATAIGLGLITLIVGGVGIMNIMLVAVAERTKEIGIRKALGARPQTILLQFLIESSLVSGVGGAVGTLGGLLLSKLMVELTPLPAAVPSEAIALGVIFGLLIGILFGFIPAYRASRLQPVDALNTGAT